MFPKHQTDRNTLYIQYNSSTTRTITALLEHQILPQIKCMTVVNSSIHVKKIFFLNYFKLKKYKPVGETPPNVFYINLHTIMFHNDLICIIQSILGFSL